MVIVMDELYGFSNVRLGKGVGELQKLENYTEIRNEKT